MSVTDYKGFTLVNENYNQAKKFLKDTWVLNKALQMVNPDYETDATGLFLKDRVVDKIPIKDIPEADFKAAEEKISEIERNNEERKKMNAEAASAERSEFMKQIRDLAGKKLGYTYMYAYFILQEGVPFEEVAQLHKDLMENSDLLHLLSRNIANYIDADSNTNFELMIDDIEKIRVHKKVKTFVNEFPSHLKKDFKKAPPYLVEKLEGIANAFAEIGMENGVINPERQKNIQRRFFDKMSRYRNLRDMAVAAELFLKAEQNAGFSNFQDAILKCNDDYGANGVEVVFDGEGIIIMEVRSFSACRRLFSNTSWCIKDSMGMWNSYVGGTKYTKQYMINNFNLAPHNNRSIIGVTIGQGQSVDYAHLKNDNSCRSEFKDILRSFEREANKKLDTQDQMRPNFLWSHFKPLTDEEIERKRRRQQADREIVKPNKTLDELRRLILEDGANVNAGSSNHEGAALHNAVIEYANLRTDEEKQAGFEKIKFLFDQGADPNLRIRQGGNDVTNLTINHVKSFDVLKLFIQKGAILTGRLIRSLADDADAIRFCLENGLDPNMGDRVPLRMAIKAGNLEAVKLLVEYNAKTTNERGWMLYAAFDNHYQDIIDYFIDDMGLNKDFDKVIGWVAMTRYKHSDGSEWSWKERYDNLAMMQKMIDDGRCEVAENGHQVTINNQRQFLDSDKVIEMFGNFVNYATRNVSEYDEFTGNAERRKKYNITK